MPTVDTIMIVDVDGTEITTGSFDQGDTITLYARGYNDTAGDLGLVAVDWGTSTSGVGTFNDTSDTSSTLFTAGMVTANTDFMFTASYSPTITDFTGDFTLNAPPDLTVDSIVIRDTDGDEIETLTLNEGGTATVYCAAYNGTTYIGEVEATWSITGGVGSVDPTTGESTEFTAGTYSTGTIVATYNSLTDSINVTVDDVTDPSPPGSPTAEEGDDEGEIDISWPASTDTDVAQYEVYRNGVLIDTVPATQTTFTDTGLEEGEDYTYTIVAVDEAGNPSDPSDPVTASPKGKAGEPGFPWWIIIVIAVIIAVILLIVLLMRKPKDKCPQCDSPVSKDAIVCDNCGYALKGAAPAAVPPGAPPEEGLGEEPMPEEEEFGEEELPEGEEEYMEEGEPGEELEEEEVIEEEEAPEEAPEEELEEEEEKPEGVPPPPPPE
jgi:hypothetical protein